VLNVFRMFGMMKGTRVEAKSSGGFSFSQVIDSGVRKNQSDLGAIAVRDKKSATVMVWNYHDNDRSAADEAYVVQIMNIPADKVIVSEYRIDKEHSNSYEKWKKMGSPQNPSPEQISQLEKSGQLEMTGSPELINTKAGLVSLPSVLARQGVVLLKIEWK
jgi:xylan 1,4-beta-xylosidase